MTSKFDSICLITVLPVDDSSSVTVSYGTGFFIYQSKSHTYVATCAHVVRDVFSEKKNSIKTLVNGKRAELKKYDQDADVAILQVSETINEATVLPISCSAKEGDRIQILGMSTLAGNREKRDILALSGSLDKESAWSVDGGSKIPTWYVKLDDTDFRLQSGYSGSPVVRMEKGDVIGIVSHKVRGGMTGIIVSASVIGELWCTFSDEMLIQSAQGTNQLTSTDRVEYFRQQYLSDEKEAQMKRLSKIDKNIARLDDRHSDSNSEGEKIDLESKIEALKEKREKLIREIES